MATNPRGKPVIVDNPHDAHVVCKYDYEQRVAWERIKELERKRHALRNESVDKMLQDALAPPSSPTLREPMFSGTSKKAATGKLTDPARIAEVQAYRDKYGATATAAHFGISRALVNDKTKPLSKKKKAALWTDGLGSKD